MVTLKNTKKILSLILAVVISLSVVPAVRLSASADSSEEYLELYDPYAQLMSLFTESTGGSVDFNDRDFSVYGNYDGIKNASFNSISGDAYWALFTNSSLNVNNVSFRVGGWYEALGARQSYNGTTKGNDVQLVFTAPASGIYKIVPGEVKYSGGKSMVLVPKSSSDVNSNNCNNFTQTFAVKKGEHTIWSKTLSLSEENMANATGNIDSDISVSLAEGERLLFRFESPENWAQCDLFVNFKIAFIKPVNQNMWDGSVSEEYAGGAGTSESPYRIKTAAQLRRMVVDGGMNTSGEPAYYTLMNDIYLNDTQYVNEENGNSLCNNWYSDTLNENKFVGTVDGVGHTIYGLYSCSESDPSYAGLIQIAATGAEIKNLHIRESYIRGSVAGAFIGTCDLGSLDGSVSLSGCSADGTVKVSGNNAGGMFGFVNTALNVENCYFTGSIQEEQATQKGAIFGGCLENYPHYIKNFYSDGIFPLAKDAENNINCSAVGEYENVYYSGAAFSGASIDGISNVAALADITAMPCDVWYHLPQRAPLLRNRGDHICDVDGTDKENVGANDLAVLRKKLLEISDYGNIVSDINRDGVSDIRDLINLKKVASNPLGTVLRNSEVQKIAYNKSGLTYEKFEITFNLDFPCDNPYDPDEVTVNGIFTYPSGKTAVVPAFYIEPMKRKDESVTLMDYYAKFYEENGDPYWCIRFAGDEVGDYEFTIQVINGGTNYIYEQTHPFELTKSDSKGFLEVSKENPQYFENSADGSLFYGTGYNVAWIREQFTPNPEHRSYEYFIGKAAEEGATLTRVWLCHWAWLEWTPLANDTDTHSYEGLGRYNQCISHSLDRVFELCEDAGIRMILTLDDNNEQLNNTAYDGWKYNPYNVENGGPAESVADYWKNARVREYYKKRLRYIVARWGYSTSLASLNLWNDMTTPSDDTISYLNELSDYTKSISEDYRTLLFGSNFVCDDNEFLDYNTQSGAGDGADKPRVIQECGYTADHNYYKSSLRSTLWNELFFGSATTMVWSHDDVNATDSWDLFGSVAEFTRDLDFNKQKYSKVYETHGKASSVLNATYPDDGIGFKTISAKSMGDIAAWEQKATQNRFEIDETNGDMMLSGISPKLYGTNADRVIYKNDPTFVINCTNGGEMVIRVSSFGSGTNRLTARRDGVIINQAKLSTTYDEDNNKIITNELEDGKYFRIELEPGTNEITISNEGHDWIEIAAYYFGFDLGGEDSVSVRRLISDNQQLALVHNTRYGEVYNNVFDGVDAVATNVTVPFYELQNGEYTLKLFDIESGCYILSEQVTVTDGTYIVDVPEINEMVAIKLIKADS